jgi:Fuc2NAc and GlcNAc transferase
MTDFLAVFGPTACVASMLLTRLALRYTVTKAVLDLPNERSLHSTPTPRGGGVAIVAVVLLGIAYLAAFRMIPPQVAIALYGGGLIVAWAGWADDRRGLSARVRVAAHAAAALWAIAWLGGMPALIVGAEPVRLGIAGSLLAMLGVVWATNFYNFMDGIDGLAAAEATSIGTAAALLLATRGSPLATVAALLAGAAAGFLPWNWERARIFMGDVGSGFLGFAFGTLAVATENSGDLPALLWILLFGVFFGDATITLLRRMLRREAWHSAHRVHAYQRAVRGGWSHNGVTIVALLVNVCLGLLAWLALKSPRQLPFALLAGGVLVCALYALVERRYPMPGGSGSPLMEKPIR